MAFAWSAYATLWPAPGRQIYFDAVLLIIGFLLLGKALEARAKRRALSALDAATALQRGDDNKKQSPSGELRQTALGEVCLA